ncbi:hypothetical protein MELA_01911 [Candidatus Methylomirabilis lanthanidiphila]|uniref:Type II secretion system protein GspC N-terminal domain-containing protein n=1 Tax=Candidatus Methylomirabilis lanthanidiphila TaxID=2211376 RepID=A0A564ZK76_9BACT|nr:hypothetical protein [Candidatus Methylomirabilis lanthanidiphila]VUZ85526.1 hypothetical protein MELA_01911 [Candidatus Methylomirabilis lanthanidiphila]
MLRPLRLLNLLLSLVAALIGVALAKTWVAPVAPVLNPVVTKSLQETEALAYNSVARPPLTQFEVLLEKNPFKQPPPRPVRSSGPPPPPPIPLPSLVGTMLVDHERKAILNDRGKANIYAIGQQVAGGVIAEIKEDRIIFKRGDTTQEIMLKAAITSATATATPSPAPAAPQAAPAAPPQVESPPVGPAGAADTDELQRRREEQKERRRQILEQRKAARQNMRRSD